VLKRDGREVAVKVQYPEAGELFTGDIHAIRKLCEWFAPEQVCTLDALEKQNVSELDYLNEANNLLEVSRNMLRHGFKPKEVLVPQPISELTTKRMLVMELLPGLKLIDGMRAYYATWAEANGTTLKRMETQARRRMERDGIPDKYDGPSAKQIAMYQKWVRVKSISRNMVIALYNNATTCLLPLRKLLKKSNNDDNINDDNGKKLAYTQETIPPNTPRIVDTLMRVHGYQLLLDGLFNADPHGGNFLLLPDGRIGLIEITDRPNDYWRTNA
jgi:aarF domain-containing kinase